MFLKGRQCARRMWLAAHQPPEPAGESEEVWEIREAEGAAVELLARLLFGRGDNMADPLDEESLAEARPQTEELIDRSRNALRRNEPVFQAHLAVDELLAIADIMEPRDGGWYIWEVKASTSVKPIALYDLGFQVEVARRSGLTVVGAGVIHLNRDYVRGEAIDPVALLTKADCSDEVYGLRAQVQGEIDTFLDILRSSAVPAATPSSHCKAAPDAKSGDRPSACGHLDPAGYCGSQLPPNWVWQLPRVSGTKIALLRGLDEPTIEGLDPDDRAAAWTRDQERVIRAVRSGQAEVDRGALQAELAKLVWPVSYMDFEFDPGMAVPRFRGTKPYMWLPFQWSLHIQRAPGGPLERPTPFLHLGEDDPREPFFRSLIAALPAVGSVVVHSKAAESTVLQQLGEALGSVAQQTVDAISARLFDTIDLARAGYYHPAQKGSYSIKKLAPALLGGGYGDLDIQSGMEAVLAWKKAINPATPAAERAELETRLKAYCGRDTGLMHEVVEALRTATTGA